MKMIDLSMDIYDGAPTYAFDPACTVKAHNTVESIGYNITQLSISSHQGTHLDAPYHFFNDGMTVDKLPLDSFTGKAICIDVSYKRPKQPLTVEDFLPYEEKIVEGSRIIYRTGWDRMFPRTEYFSDFPYLSMELAEWFAGKRIKMLGMDTPSPSAADWMYVHHALLGKGIVIVEGLANLEALDEEFIFIAAPLKIKGRDGSPVRAIAICGL